MNKISTKVEATKHQNSNILNYSNMLISREKGIFKPINTTKVSQGSFYTKGEFWLTKPIRIFILEIIKHTKTVLDPFAGDGDILRTLEKHFHIKTVGMDIGGGKWIKNDSLLSIPKIEDFFICTNPPYLAKYSAKRKGVLGLVKNYYGKFDDLYQVALMRCLEAARYTIAIIPETFFNSSFPMQHLKIVSIIEDNPFGDTDQPILVACFDTSFFKGLQKAKIYIGNEFAFEISELNRYRFSPSKKLKIVFNDPEGRLAFKAVDGVNPGDKIRFSKAEGFYYSRKKIKVSSRLLTYIDIPALLSENLDKFVEIANSKISEIRTATKDLILSPFKGNNKSGKRRRRLDYKLARCILESSYFDIYPEHGQKPLF